MAAGQMHPAKAAYRWTYRLPKNLTDPACRPAANRPTLTGASDFLFAAFGGSTHHDRKYNVSNWPTHTSRLIN
jgi:hypothetical protein